MVDASVAFKWILNEEPGAAAAEWLRARYDAGEIDFHAPDHLLLELANAIRFARLAEGRDRRALLRDAAALGVQLVRPDEALIADALAIATAGGISIYDALYCALADHLKVPLITADEKLVRKLPKWGRFQPLRTFRSPGGA